MGNPNLRRTLSRAFYSLSRRYGTQAYIYRSEDASVNMSTGVKTVDTERVFIRQCVVIPGELTRDVTFTPAMMQSIRPAAWQGVGSDEEVITLLLYKPDLKNWGNIEPDQWARVDKKSYQISRATETDGGWVLTATVAKGSGPDENDDDF